MKSFLIALFLGFSVMLHAQIVQDTLHKDKPYVMDEVKISSNAFNKIQSQNVMKIEHKSIKELQKKELQR